MTDLQISVEASEGLERRIRVQVPANRIETEVETRLRNVRKSAKMKGFRPGKVPSKVILQKYGGQVRQEVLREIVESSYSEAIHQEKFRPAGTPKIEPERLETGKDFTFTATFEIFPEFRIGGLDKLKVERPETKIQDSDIDAMIETLQKQRVTWSPVERAAADGDRVTVNFEGSLNGDTIENGRGEQVPIVLGEGQMIGDFEKNLVGMSGGEDKTFKVKFPKDYHASDLAGKKVSFSATVTEVAESRLPDVDAEFIVLLGVDSGEMNDFRADLRGNMDREADTKIKAEIKRQVMEQLLEANPINIPAVLVDQEAEVLRSETMRSMGITKPDQAPPADNFREAAERRVRVGLLVGAVIEEHKLVIDRNRVNQKVDEICTPYEKPDEIRKIYFQNPQLMSQVENLVMEEQVVEWLVSRATVQTKETDFNQLIKG